MFVVSLAVKLNGSVFLFLLENCPCDRNICKDLSYNLAPVLVQRLELPSQAQTQLPTRPLDPSLASHPLRACQRYARLPRTGADGRQPRDISDLIRPRNN
jgi:hypothetical protein